jgi:hypothetical protein
VRSTSASKRRRLTIPQAPYVFPITGGRKIEHLKGNIEALGIELFDEEVQQIDNSSSFNLGYPHTTLSGEPGKVVSAENPAFAIAMCCYFEGVEEVKVCGHPLLQCNDCEGSSASSRTIATWVSRLITGEERDLKETLALRN